MPPALKSRIVVRISEDLESWIAEQGEREGLDPATWVRSILTSMRNGRLAAPIVQPMHTVQASAPIETLPPEPPADPVDTDAMVKEALGAAAEDGLLASAADLEAQGDAPAAGGARPLYRPPVRFSPSQQPGWIED